MKTLTLEQIVEFTLCCIEDKEQTAKLYEIGARQKEWSALDVLSLHKKEVRSADKLWLVLREDFIDAPILHEFACKCAEAALALVTNPDPRSIAAIEAKRKWLKGEIDDSALADARDAAWDAGWNAGDDDRAANLDVACAAAWNSTKNDARNAACATACDAAWTASKVARDAAWDTMDNAYATAYDVAWRAVRDEQIVILTQMLNTQESSGRRNL